MTKQKTKQVKNISGLKLSVVGIGIVEAEEVVTVPQGFNNGNFKQVKAKISSSK